MGTKKCIKKLTSCLLAVMMMTALLTGISLTANAETYSGSCGTSATWTYDSETKTLTIAGAGVAASRKNAAWADLTIEHLVVEEGVDELWDNFLKDCTALKSISLPSTVHTINDYAFRGCTALEELYLPEGISQVRVGAFYGCTSLKKVMFNNKTKQITIGDNVFTNCSSLKYVVMKDRFWSISKSAFYGCTELTDVYIGMTRTAWDNKWGTSTNKPVFATSSTAEEFPTLHFTDENAAVLITLDAVGGRGIVPVSTVDENGKSTASLPVPTKDKCKFEGWYDAKTGGNKVTDDTVFTANKTLYARWSLASTQFAPQYTGYYKTKNTVYFYMDKYLPTDAMITGVMPSLPSVGEKQNMTYSSNIKESYAVLYTNALDAPASDNYTITVYTSNYGNVTINAVINLVDFAVTGYDSANGSVTVVVPAAGTYEVVFADYDGGVLKGADVVTLTVEEDKTGMQTASHTENVTLGAGDKIMLWNNASALSPLCGAYEVN